MLVLDYVGVSPAKGGLFRAGPMVKGDGCVQAWAGHAFFQLPALAPLAVRRMPAFFETFPVLLLDRAGLVRGVIPFRRAESRWSLSAGSTSARFAGGALDGAGLQQPAPVKAFARKAQLGEILAFERSSSAAADGLFRASARGWFAYSHALLMLLLAQGHLWHAARSLFKDTWTGARASEGAEKGSHHYRVQAGAVHFHPRSAADFNTEAARAQGWLRDYLWAQSARPAQAYGAATAAYTLTFLLAHFVWSLSLMFLFSGRGYWQELVESLPWAHLKLRAAPSAAGRPLSIAQGRAAGGAHFTAGGPGAAWSFLFSRLLP